MLSLLIIFIMLWNFYIGYNRGIILQGFYFVGILTSLFVASQHYLDLAKKIALWVPYSSPTEGAKMLFFKDINIFELSKVYYAGIAFFVIFLATYAAVRLIGILTHFFPIDYYDNQKANIASGIIASLVIVLVFSIGLSILATVPMESIQTQLHNHFLTRLLIEHCPPVTTMIRNLWITKVL
ncbi:CvpA family protein [Streptococcus parauberis]|uniref:CvpA family protein n=1 Tax=Streptococcus parauberis TaxID=1348 RepID=UPI000E303B24|nr:CvpA family protein [Streptococcus parauberis]RFE00816.1 Colicin V production protein [Streptococcus parauberis]